MRMKIPSYLILPALVVVASLFSETANAELKVGTEVHWAPDEQSGIAFVDTIVATGPDFVIFAKPDPTGEWETSYGVKFSGLDGIICANFVPIHSTEDRTKLAAMWPLKIGDSFSRNLNNARDPYTITVVRRDRLVIAGIEEDVFVLNLHSETEDNYVYISERFKTDVRVDWSPVVEIPDSKPITDTVNRIVETTVKTIQFGEEYEILAGLDYDKLENCAALLPKN